jgi:hypothetical protein
MNAGTPIEDLFASKDPWKRQISREVLLLSIKGFPSHIPLSIGEQPLHSCGKRD